jgi:tRNA G18 (ribose-2'-O)-methylase SpoU
VPQLENDGENSASAGPDPAAFFWLRGFWQREAVKTLLPTTRGYFGIGGEGISKAVNLGNLLRSAHAFGASFAFTVGADERALEMRSDTSHAEGHLPLYHWPSLAEMRLPKGCSLVGVEILDEAVDLPSFPHPLRAAYVLGPERGRLTPELVARCQHLVRIPTAFSLNVATAGAIVMYDRLRCLGRFARRPIAEGADVEPRRPHIQGAPRKRSAQG